MCLAEALAVVSEDNIVGELRSKDFIALLVKAVNNGSNSTDPQMMHLASLCGLLLTAVDGALNESETLSAYKLVLEQASAVLRAQCLDKLMEVAAGIEKLGENDEVAEELNNACKQLINILSAKRISIEAVANVYTENDDDEDSDGDEMEIDDQLSSDGESLGNEDVGLQDTKSVSPEIETLIKTSGVFDLICSHLDTVDESLRERLCKASLGRELIDHIVHVQRSALLCISNLVPCLNKHNQHEVDALLTQRLLSLIRRELNGTCANNLHSSLLPEAVSVTRALFAEALLDANAAELVPMLLQMITSFEDDLLAINAIKLLGCFAVRTDDMTQIEFVATVLLQVIDDTTESPRAKCASLDVKAEALDNLIDIFAEDHKTDQVVTKMNLLPKLRDLCKRFKAEIKEQKRRGKKKQPVADTIALNVTRFIKYKHSMLAKK